MNEAQSVQMLSLLFYLEQTSHPRDCLSLHVHLAQVEKERLRFNLFLFFLDQAIQLISTKVEQRKIFYFALLAGVMGSGEAQAWKR